MMRTLNTFAVDLIQIPSVADLFWYVAQNVVGKLNFVDCVIYQADEARTSLQQVAAWGEKNPFGRSILNPLVIPFGRGITGKVASTKAPIIVPDLLIDQNYIPDTEPARSEICVPLVFRGQVVGVIDCEHPEPNAFGEAELEILSTVAAMTGAKLELLAESQRSTQRYNELMSAHAQLVEEIDHRKALEAKLFEARRLEAIGKLAGRFAHEFNNLLTVVLGNLEMLKLEALDPDATNCLDDARKSADRGAGLVRDMLAFARRTRLEPTTVDLNEVVSSFSAAQDESWGSRLQLDLPENLWPISADRRAVEGALRNLVANAIEAMGSHGQVLLRTENVHRTMADNRDVADSLPPGRYVCLSVTDTGGGIPADRMTQIFDPFFTSKPVGVGTGLGLSIVLGLAQQSGGSVTVTSEIDKGSTFCLCFPALI
jgi:signal transduction histidine kinase